MTQKDDEFLAKLRAAFQVEAREHLEAISAGLLELEKAADVERRQELVAQVFREAHSLKGAARAVNLSEVEAICQSLESVLAAWKHRAIEPVAESLDPLHRAIDFIGSVVGDRGQSADGDRVAGLSIGEAALHTLDDVSGLLRDLAQLEAHAAQVAPLRPAPRTASDAAQRAAKTEPSPSAPAAPAADAGRENVTGDPGAATPIGSALGSPTNRDGARLGTPSRSQDRAETLRISTAKIDSLLRRAEELLSAKLSANQRLSELRGVAETLDVLERECGNRSFVAELRSRMAELVKSADLDRRAAAGMIDALLEDAKRLRMQPCATLFAMFPKLVRDQARDQTKEIDLDIRGSDVEIDKRILDEIKDAIMHLLRNAVDHGIERLPERAARNKPLRGTIRLAASQVEGNKVEIQVADDGAGIDLASVAAAAVRHGAVDEAAARDLSEADALALIFQADVSTADAVTAISGRGLGLAIVRERVERLGGRVVVESSVGTGTTFRLLLPLTLATFRGILVRVADQVFVVPTAQVERVVGTAAAEIGTVQNRPTLRLNGRPVPLTRLDEILEFPRSAERSAADQVLAVVIRDDSNGLVPAGAGERRVGFQVDAVLEEQEVLVKRLAAPLARVRNIAGATVLGSGRVVPVLNVSDLLKSAVNLRGRPALAEQPAHESAGPRPPESEPMGRRRAILVVEDSITARMLLKNILESAGHRVRTAVDGVDAFTQLRTNGFDLVVSDVEMPRMNGFDLTTKIRADKQLADLPVVLVTALASREDRERGVDVGANAYIVKSSFDQSDLLAVVESLV